MGVINSMTAREDATLYSDGYKTQRKQLNLLPIILLEGQNRILIMEVQYLGEW